MDCDIEIHDDLGTFAASVREFLEQREAENGLMLGLLGARPGDSSGDGPIMVRAAADGQTVFVAFRRGPHLVVTRGPDVALVATAARLGALGLEAPGVIGPAREAESFAQIWAEQMGCTARLVVKQRLYQLTQVTWPQGVPGNMRALGTADSGFGGPLGPGLRCRMPACRTSAAAWTRRATSRPAESPTGTCSPGRSTASLSRWPV